MRANVPKDAADWRLFGGVVTITAADERNPNVREHVCVNVSLECSSTPHGFGQALASAARAFIDSSPSFAQGMIAREIIDGFAWSMAHSENLPEKGDSN